MDLMKQKISLVVLLVLLLAACVPAQQPAVDVRSGGGTAATEAPTALPADTPTQTANTAPPSATPVPEAAATSGAGCARADAAKLGESIAEGYAFTSPDEDWFTGYQQEVEAFYRTIAHGDPAEPESDSRLAANSISTIYSAYVSAQQNGAEVPVKSF